MVCEALRLDETIQGMGRENLGQQEETEQGQPGEWRVTEASQYQVWVLKINVQEQACTIF